MSNYFRQVPDLEYVSRSKDAVLGEYSKVKNLFKRGKLREDIFKDLSFFNKYNIKGDDRPDNVANEVYGDSNLDWVVLICNNILNVQSEWPMSQQLFDEYVLGKYGDYDTLYNGIHHYETLEVKNSQGVVVLPAGLQVDSDYTLTFYDYETNAYQFKTDIVVAVTNYEYEDRLETDKRTIFILKPSYLNVVKDDLEEIMTYEKGSTQYVSGTLKRADNIRLYN
tara:strand:- start:225 stop:893 length:669 start_codon:yes stop_codon:yes gene_type:complete